MEITASRRLKKSDNGVPFHYQLKADLKQRIDNQEFAVGSLIPTEHQLMAEYAVSRTTVIRAVADLAKEGVLYRRPGKGTFVAKPALKLTGQEIVGMIMQTTGHVYGPLSMGIIHGLTEHDYFCLAVTESASKETQPKYYEKIKSLIERNPAVLVIEGSCEFPYDEGTCAFPTDPLEEYRGRIIFVERLETEKNYPASYILSDYFEGGRLVAEHFLNAGHGRILYYGGVFKPVHRSRMQILAGVRQALRDQGLPEEGLTLCLHGADTNDAELDEALRSLGEHPAVFCSTDSDAKRVYAAARRLGLAIPRDLSVIGYYNTPWCEMLEPALTSVSIREQDIAEQVVEAILTGGDRNVLLKPRLVLRDSTVNP